jgi:8-oxo-dGTP diphosphatase
MSQETMKSIRRHRHIGAYGICIVEGEVLLIRKLRGPYIGLLDLPGGGIEFGEEPEAAVRREFIEETGKTVTHAALLCAASNRVRYLADDGVEEELHHLGLVYTLTVASDEPGDAGVPREGEDSGGAVWLPIAVTDAMLLTPFARLVLQRHSTKPLSSQ